MTILDTWKDSLKLFVPSNFKLFLLVTANAALRTYKIIFTQLWWLFGLLFGLELFITYQFLAYGRFVYFFKGLLFPNIYLLLFVLAARPSIDKKIKAYFGKYIKHCIYFVITMLLLRIIAAELFFDVVPLARFTLFYRVPFELFWASPIFIISALFFVDTRATIKSSILSVYRALKMILFNYPFFIICHTVLALGYLGIFLIIKNGSLWLFEKLFLLLGIQHCIETTCGDFVTVLLPLIIFFFALFLYVPLVCFYSNFYTKKIHDTFELYWGKQ